MTFWRRTSQPAPQQFDFSGHFEHVAFAIGDHAVANTYNGTVIQQYSADTAPRPTRRPPPQRREPRDPVDLLGREGELQRIHAALSATSAIALYGSAGVGKTVLLKHVARDVGNGWSDGILYANVGAQPLEDVLQWLFTVFWDTGELVYVPGLLRVGEYLADVRALVVLDDVGLDGGDVERLLGGAPVCGFVIGADQPRLPQRSHPLGGLDADAARDLFARVLGRALSASEQPAVDAFAAGVERLPGYVVTGAELVRDGVCGPADLIEQAGAVLARRRLVALPAEQQELLGLLAELAPAPVPADRLDADAEARLERLREAAFVERHSPRYTLAGPLDAALARDLPHIGAAELLRRWAREADRVRPDDVASVTAAVAWGQRAGEDEEVLSAARALAPAMVRNGRTGAWGAVAQAGLDTARRLDRLADTALFLHEHGTRLGCLGDRGEAQRALTEARDIRLRLHDERGAAVCEHNLRELFSGAGGPGEGRHEGGGGNGGWPPAGMIAAVVGALALAVVVAVLAFGGSDPRQGVVEPPKTVPGAKDSTAPTITVLRPRNGDRFVAGAKVLAAYRCRDRGRPARACKGTVPDGRAIDTTAGDHEFRVRAVDETGNVRTVTVFYRAEQDAVPTPKIEITSPADGGTYESGSRIRAQYRCTNARVCEGDVRVGVPVNGRPGTHDFSVRATGTDGTSVQRKVTYTVDAPPGPGPPPPPPAPDPLTVDATAQLDPNKRVTVVYECAGGTAPLACTATLDGKPVASGTPIGCGRHKVIVSAADRAGETKQGEFIINGGDCPEVPR